ncbi:MAG TPA: tetratricopeptide repeat protein [Chloroflexi bacterium]|nr:tetratricopeptide repeat protein [Chloroflexota bacterium]
MALDDRIRLPISNLIHRRPRLLDKLAEFIAAEQRLITVYAPGGYGKSILLADFAQTTDLPVCWCSLEAADRDPTSFLTLLAHGITDRFRELDPSPLFQLIERGDTQASIRRIADALASVGPHIIIIDDYHKAISAGMTLAMNNLLEQLPETSIVIMAARGGMTLETSQILDLLIDERATGLSEDELRFNPEEIQRVMRKRFGRQIDLTDAAELARATDGNIAQVLLAGHMQSANISQIASGLKRRLGEDHTVIYDYLAREVFDKQPPEIQRFLLWTSVLPDMTVDICDELLDITESGSCLEELARRDLFITRIGLRLRYHDLFAEFLQSKLKEEEAEYRRALRKAAQLLAARSRFEEAVNLYLGAQAWDQAASLLEMKGYFFYNTGRALTLDQWLNQISTAELARRPRLLLLQGDILADHLSDYEQAIDSYQRAEKQYIKQGELIGAVEAQVGRANSLRQASQVKEALELISDSLIQLEILGPNDHIAAYAIRIRGLVYGTAGNITGALADFRRALTLHEKLGNTHKVGVCHHDIGVCLASLGNISGADHHYKRAVRIWEALGNANDLANTLNSLGVLSLAIGHYGEALKYFKDSLDIARQIASLRRSAFARTGIGDAYLGRRDYTLAAEAYAISIEWAREASVQSLEVYNLIKQGECFYGQQDFVQALKLANRAREIAIEVELTFERGLACALQGKLYVVRAEYEAGFAMFAEAIDCFSENDILEQAKARLWWGYSLFLDVRSIAAFDQLQKAIKLTLTMGDLMPALRATAAEIRPLLSHFLYRIDTPADIRNNISLFLAQTQSKLEIFSPGLQVFTFGPPALVVTGRYKHFSQRGRIRKMPEFLAYLLIEGQREGCRRSEMSVAFWPEQEREKASANFYQMIRRLRDRTFESQDSIIAQDGYYRINEHYLEWCDALAFEKLFERAAKASSDEALVLWLELINLYQGEFLAGFELGEWGMTRRATYESRFLQLLKLASDRLLAQGDAGEALNVVNKGLARDYFREDLHRNALQAYAQLDLYDHLARHYADLCDVFERELAIAPDITTQTLYKQLIVNK